MDFIRLEDCGNSPKNALVQDICISYMKYLIDFDGSDFQDPAGKIVLEYYSDRENESLPKKYDQLIVTTSIAHGKIGCAEINLIDSRKISVRICIVIEFETSSTRKVARITRYVA